MKSFLRTVLVLPAMILGVVLGTLISAVCFTMPLTFIEHLTNRLGGWSIGNLIFGRELKSLITDGTTTFLSGAIGVWFGLAFALNVFPFPRYRWLAGWLLFAFQFSGFAAQKQLEIYGSHALFYSKLAGALMGFALFVSMTRSPTQTGLLEILDKRLQR